MRARKFWNEIKPNENDQKAILIALIVGIVYYAFNGYYDIDFAHYPIEPYGRLWYLLNPFFQQPAQWALMTALVYLLALIPQAWLVKKGKLSRSIVILNVFSALLFRVLHAQQDMTVIMFAPLATVNPLFSLGFILQKVALGWSWDLSDPYMQGWFAQVRNAPNVVGVMAYWLLLFWFLFPIAFYIRKRLEKRNK